MKRIYSIVLMVTALLIGTNAWADNVAKIVETGVEYETLQKAVKAAAAGQTIKLIADINCLQGVYVDKSLTIDLDGHTYQSEGAKDSEANQDCASRNFKIVGDGTEVTVKNGIMIAFAQVNPDPTKYGKGIDKGAEAGIGNYPNSNGAYGTIRTEAGSTVNLENLELYNYHPWGLNIKICSTTNKSLDNLQVNPSTANIKNCKVYSSIGGGIEVAGGVAHIESTQFIQTGANLSYSWIATCVSVSTLGRLTVNTTSFKSVGDHSIYVYSSGGLIQVESGVFAGVTDVVNITKATAASVATEMYGKTNYNAMSAENKAKAHAQAQNLITQFVTELGGTNIADASQIIVKEGDFDGKITLNQDTKLDIQGGTFINTGMTTEQLESFTNPLAVEVIQNPDGSESVVPLGSAKADFDNVGANSVVNVPANIAEPIVIEDVVEIKQLSIADGSSVIVKDGGELHINGQMGIIIGNTGNLTIEAGGKVIVEKGLVHNSNAENFVIETTEGKNAIFLIAPETQMYGGDNPAATVKFISKSTTNGSYYTKQRFGIPTIGAVTSMTTKYNNTDVQTAIAKFNYDLNKWEDFGWINVSEKDENLDQLSNPFDYYQMQHNTPNMGTVVTMKGELYGNLSPVLSIRGNFWNGFANSYMAPISGEQLLGMIPDNVDKAFYLYDINAEYATWNSVTYIIPSDMQDIQPMQPFLIRNTLAAATAPIDYATAVYNPATASASAPARQATNNWTVAKILVAGENCTDRVVVAEDAQFSAAFDNGYDAAKFMNDGINMYVTADEKMSNFATDNLENTYVGFQSVKGGKYTIDFSNVQGDNLTLIDHVTGARVAMAEGNVYEFIADANTTNDYRFQIVGSNNAPTGVENVSAANNGGVYTIMGQYVGKMSDWNELPAGIYVVDGVKRIK